MKRLPLILNIVLAVAVVALYVLYFTGIGSPKKNTSFDGLPAGSANGGSIFYVQIDSVLSQFRYGHRPFGRTAEQIQFITSRI